MALVGIYGGTFNPIHVGHLRAAEEVAEALGLARVIFVPSATPPHKPQAGSFGAQRAAGERSSPSSSGDVIAPAADRLAWVQLAIAGNPRFEASAIEVERGGASYLVDTLGALRALHADDDLVFLVGSDAFAEMGEWRAPRELFALAHYAVMLRPPLRSGSLATWLPEIVRGDFEVAPDGSSARHRRADAWLRLIEIAGFDVSASDLRRRLRDGRSVRYLLPDTVREAVLASGAFERSGG